MFSRLARKYLPLALILALVLTASFGSTGDVAAAGETDLGRAIAAQEAHTDALMAIDGVIGTAVGRGTGGGHIVLALTTAGGIHGIPGAVDGVIVRPYVTGEILAQPRPGSGGVDRTARFDRPVPIGVSTGHPSITAGTIGARVVGSDGTLYALSNNHVYANQNAAALGDAVIQPGTFDGGASPGDDIGTLSAFQEIFFDGSDNTIDAAIATVATVDGVLTVGNSTPAGEGYGTPSSFPWDASIGLNVTKYGRTTGSTNGKVDAINATVNVNYGSPNGTALFVGQVIIKGKKGSFSAGGDSGSLIVSNDGNHPVALLFAGSSTVTIGNPIGAVLARFGVTVDDGSAPAPSPEFGSISGTVTDADGGASIDGASVSTSTGQSASTDAFGDYTIANVPVGDVGVTASATGFETSGTLTATVITDTTTENVNFALIAVVAPELGSISGTVTDADGGVPIDGASVSTSTGQSASTDAFGDYTIANVPVGDVGVTASATGFETSGTLTATVITDTTTENVNFALTAVVTAENVIVDSITYATSGGRDGNKHLLITIALLDDLGNPVESATVSISVDRNTIFFGSGTGVTGVEGTVTFQASNAPKGTYTTTVTDVSAAGLLWDGTYPSNSYDKE